MATQTETRPLPPSVVRKYQERVDRGARLLDKRLPGWWRHIRLTRLNMAEGVLDPRHDECGCVGAQVAAAYKTVRDSNEEVGFFSDTMAFLFRGDAYGRQNVSHGFVVGSPECRKNRGDDTYLLLDELWAKQVRARRKR